jgi:hydrogenase expression/formation protein HypD
MNELRDKKVIQGLLQAIAQKAGRLPTPITIMEVCGTHTMAIHRYGLKQPLLDAGVRLLSGPGCPVCITPDAFHEAAIDFVTEAENRILTTFGDMTRVPTPKGSLQKTVPAAGSRIKVVYSPEEALDMARSRQDKDVVFFGVGFETTIPSIALAGKAALEEGLSNFSVLSALWVIPPPLRAIVQAEDVAIQGFLYPGHVSAIIGLEPYHFIAEEFGLPGTVAGFEPADILLAVASVLDQILDGQPTVGNTYSRVVRPGGNPRARSLMEEILEPMDTYWRGLGIIPASGLRFRKRYEAIDAEIKYGLRIEPSESEQPGCRCGEVLRGKIEPPDCGLFGGKCRPDSPQGPCMVSFEGSCLAHYKYRGAET